MNNNIPNYIVPIFQLGKFIGTGYIVEDTLFTARHVGLGLHESGQDVYAFVNRKKYILPPFASLFIYRDIDTMAYRLADKDFESPLQFAENEPIYDSEQGEPVLYQSKHFQPLEDGRFMYCETDCIATRKTPDDEWRFDGFSINPIFGGASGSPLIKDNLVYGMLVSGRKYDADICELAKKEAIKAGELTEEQAELAAKIKNNNHTYIMSSIIKQMYERDLKNNPEKKIPSM